MKVLASHTQDAIVQLSHTPKGLVSIEKLTELVGLVGWLVGLCCLMTPGLSKDIRCHVRPWHTFFSKIANHQIRHQATDKVGCRPGDCIWSLNVPPGFVWVHIG